MDQQQTFPLHHQFIARLYGIGLLLSFISYATGISLMDVVQQTNLTPTALLVEEYKVATGALLVVVLHTCCNMVLLISLFVLMKPLRYWLSYVYLSLGITSTWLLALGGLMLLMPLALAQEAVNSNQTLEWFYAIQSFGVKGNHYCYQIGMTIWGIGGLAMCYVFCQTGWVPLFWARWGWVGYMLFITGTLLELFGMPYGVMLSLPGGVFEITIGIWFMVKSKKLWLPQTHQQ